MNLLYCGNFRVFDGLMLSLLSIIKKSGAAHTAYVLTMDLSEIDTSYRPISREQADYLDAMLKQYNQQSGLVLIDATEVFKTELPDKSNYNTSYTPYTLLRLIADKVTLPDRILYLDTDTMANGNIEEISEYDISDYEFAAVLDHLGKTFISETYVNAGVLYLNLPKIRESGLLEKARRVCCEQELVFPDQDALNQVAQKVLLMSDRFNEQKKLRDNTVIQHFSQTICFSKTFRVINVKPWDTQQVREVLRIDTYDDVFEEYISRRDNMDESIAPRRRERPVMSWREQKKTSYKILADYVKKNNGIFRKGERR